MTFSSVNSLLHLSGRHLLVLNWRDIRHSQAGGAEQYMHEISRRWVDAGVKVTWFTGRDGAQTEKDTIDGVNIIRGGGTLALYPRAALRLLSQRGAYDAVVDCQNGIPFFSPLFVQRGVPVVQVVHHVHQEQFRTRFSPPMAALGRYLEGTVAKAVYGPRAIAAVSPSTRLELRRLGFQGPIHVVPNGTIEVPDTVGPRDPDPTITIVSRLVPHKRIDTLLGQVAIAATAVPRLRLEIVGDGPERTRLESLARDLGLDSTVTFHGYVPDHVRNTLLNRAWLTMCTSAAEGWGCSVIEAAAWGVPCLALRVPGIRDSVVDGSTGWLVDSPKELGAALIGGLDALSDAGARSRISAACQEWARCFTWDRSAALLAGVLFDEVGRTQRGHSDARRAVNRSDMSTLASFELPAGTDLAAVLRATDEIAERDGVVSAVLKGCDEFEASAVMRRLGATHAELRSASGSDLLAGPSRFRAVDPADVRW
ncbi:glycosyltransferase family 4 protein [Arthrobacter sp. KNU-44]|uniref:glycosyltransferase family 4 protein n=1 Tax=unclassified Arthrobacter TaxID=235627 RepID=UPI003F43F428